MKAIYNAKVITNQGTLVSHAVVFTDKVIAVVPDNELEAFMVQERIDASGNYVAPGFIDIHVHGCAGADTMDEDDGALDIISNNLVRTGVTAFLPTTMTMPFDFVEHILKRIRSKVGQGYGAEIVGCHLEGPFINKEYKGAQDKTHMLNPDFSKIRDYTDVIKIVTIAPELPGSLEFVRQTVADGIIVSIGHSAATYDRAMTAIKMGASHITHTFNTLGALNHRQPGVIGALADSNVTCDLIADNIHVHPAVQRLLLKLTGPEKLILGSDAMRATLMKDGEYDLGGQKVFVKNGEARLENGALAGSVLTLGNAVANFTATSGLALSEVIKMVTLNPARRLGIADRKGTIEAGKDADFVMFDSGLDVVMTVVRGQTVYRRYQIENCNCQGL